ncbi:MAG: TOBE domain-containing protein [Desulfitobacteriaceae bacterium]
MHISARNQLKARITGIKNGPVSTEVVLNLNGQTLVSVITTGSAESMGLKVGDEVTAIVKSNSIMLAN